MLTTVSLWGLMGAKRLHRHLKETNHHLVD